jgi:hypothetical protein
MSKSKSSKNNIEARGQTRDYFHNGRKIKPVKLISDKHSFLAAEYDDSLDLVMENGRPVTWDRAKIMS